MFLFGQDYSYLVSGRSRILSYFKIHPLLYSYFEASSSSSFNKSEIFEKTTYFTNINGSEKNSLTLSDLVLDVFPLRICFLRIGDLALWS